MPINQIRRELRKKSSKAKARTLQSFFKTGPGEYAQGDIFIGVTVPDTRKIAKKHPLLSLKDCTKLLRSPVHEERLCGLLIMVDQFNTGDAQQQKKIFDHYLKNIKQINNWDLVDLTAPQIVGAFLADRNRTLLIDLSRSKNLWERRISIVATYFFIKRNIFTPTLRISRMLLQDKEDLIHKACGWMLREVGKRDQRMLEEEFLRRFSRIMPRTMLRYTIERFSAAKKRKYLQK